MNIISNVSPWWIQEHDRLVRKYLAEHKDDYVGEGRNRWFVRLRLEFAAWRYAKRRLRQDPHSFYGRR